ncbi:MAG: hypothetical protein E3J82_04690 [Candidatus Thorarchaeota archaeon]|nr:MAG: hypothetical protein E3J82_04690 [Candidatus Thorarchaeota archaeon]
MTTLNVDQLDKWYRKRLGTQSKDFIKRAEKSYKNVKQTLKDIGTIAGDLEDSAKDDSETIGIASRFAMKLDSIVKDFDVESDITYASTEAMQEEIQRFIQELWGAGARWIRRMDKKHKNMIKLLDTYMKELAKEMKVLSKLLYEFSWVKDLERIGGRIQTLSELTYSAEGFEEQIRQIQLKINTAKKEHSAAKQAYDEFTDTSNVAELLSLDEESEHIGALLRMRLNPLKKQVKKFMQRDTGVRVSPSGQRALSEYFEDPLTAIIAEPDGTPGLIEGLEGLQKALDTGKLKLKDRLARRASEEIEAIKNGSLSDLQLQAKELDEKRRTFAGSDVYKKSAVLIERLNEASKNLEYHTNDLLKVGADIKKQIARVEEFRTRIESEILESFEEKIIIKIDELGLEPLLTRCVVN